MGRECAIALNVPGTYTLMATYSGDNYFLPSSATEDHQVGGVSMELSSRLFLPNIVRDFCLDFFDGFSSSSTGWETGEDEFARYEYLNGEYRILTKNDQFIYLPGFWTLEMNYISKAITRLFAFFYLLLMILTTACGQKAATTPENSATALPSPGATVTRTASTV